jgi:hypothetical protein
VTQSTLRALAIATISALAATTAQAQRRAGGGGGGRGHAAASRPAPHASAKPARPTAGNAAAKPSRPDAAGKAASARDGGSGKGGRNLADASKGQGGDRNVASGNKVNIDNSKRNVNVNVDNSKHFESNRRNTVVRRNNVAYGRPPYRYGGYRYYSYRPYYYHPYRPYYWGPAWHPWGFFVTTLAVTAIVVSANNQQYHYDSGVFYAPENNGYTAVAAPVGATVSTIPSAAQPVVVNETTNNYYYGGTYYEKSDKGYTVVPPTAGTVVESLPDGGEEVTIGDQKYVKVGDTYYIPVQRDGKDVYEVAQVDADAT